LRMDGSTKSIVLHDIDAAVGHRQARCPVKGQGNRFPIGPSGAQQPGAWPCR
jgi:hypothetical protein